MFGWNGTKKLLSDAWLQLAGFPSSLNAQGIENEETEMVDYAKFWYSPSQLTIPNSGLTATITAGKEEKQRFNI